MISASQDPVWEESGSGGFAADGTVLGNHLELPKKLRVLCQVRVPACPAAPKGTSPCPLARGSASPRWLQVSSQSLGRAIQLPADPLEKFLPCQEPCAHAASRREGSPMPGPHPRLPAGREQDLQAADTDILRGRGRVCRGAEPSSSRFHSQIYWCCEENETMWSRRAEPGKQLVEQTEIS